MNEPVRMPVVVSLPIRPLGATHPGGLTCVIQSPYPYPTYQQVLDMFFDQHPGHWEWMNNFYGVIKVDDRLIHPCV